ncbi:MAG: GAF domain-containing protein [Deltaproteobacteria bacterium]|nr:GAF domain-containing protein [Deltaproteobacteria bacterium]
MEEDKGSVNSKDCSSRLKQAEARLEAMQAIGMALASTLELDKVMEIVMDQVTKLLYADRSSLYLVDEDRGELWSMVAQGGNMEEIRLPLDKGVAGWVAANGKTVNLVDAYKDQRFDPEIDSRTGYKTISMLCMPVRNPESRIIGVVQVLNKKGGRFTVGDEKLLQALASQAAVSIENSRLYLQVVNRNMELDEARMQLEKRVKELNLLYELEKKVSTAGDLSSLLDQVLAKAMEVVGAEAGSILLKEGDKGELYFKTALGEKKDAIKRIKLPMEKGVAGFVARTGQARIANDLHNDPLFASDIAEKISYETRNIICVPLGEREQPLGALELLNKDDRGSGTNFDEDDMRLLTLVAGQTARAIVIEREAEEARRADRLSTIGRMLAGVMHDFKTPMTIISGYAQMLAQVGDDATRDEYASTIVRQVDVINKMIQEMLSYARGESEVLLHRVHLDRFFDEMQRMLMPQFQEKGIDLEVDLKYSGSARLDEDKLRRLVQNIARNAYDALEKGGIFRIEVDLDESSNQVLLYFEDNGPGIAPEIRDKVFESFATHGKKGGTGLGLAIAKKFVLDHGGEISFTTKEKQGTRFLVKLPRGE